MVAHRFRTARLRRFLTLGFVMLSLVMQPHTLRPYLQDAYLLQSVTIVTEESDDLSCHPPSAQGLMDWINAPSIIIKKKQLKLLNNIPTIHQIPVEYHIDPLSRKDEEDGDDYAALSFRDYQFTLFSNNASSVALSEYTIDRSWEEVSSSLLSRDDFVLDAIYCRVPNQRVWFLYHFPHFVQRFFPCWSMLHALMEEPKSWNTTLVRTRFYIVLPESYQVRPGSYIDALLQHITSRNDFALSPVISIVYGNATLPPPPAQADSPSNVSLLIECTYSEGGWGAPVKYFLAPPPADVLLSFHGVPQLQRMVLGNETPSDAAFKSNTSILQVLILDRVGSTRTITYVSEIQMLLEEATFTMMPNHCDDTTRMVRLFNQNDPPNAQILRFNVTYIPSFTGWTVRDQARAMHRADIILSPHGAQLTNAIFIRPCTVVLELYPYAYYVPFFPSLVRSAAGIPWVAYPQCYDRYADRNQTMRDASHRVKVRSVPLFIAPHSIATNLLPMVQAHMQCRCERLKV
jgi:Glycosyltransferase 61